jgi:hypothetical protein
MTVIQQHIFYDKVVKVTAKYLGPAAERFVARQIRNHLDKEPEQLKSNELADLIDWFRIAMAILSEDEQVVRDYTSDLESLIKS